VAKSHSAGWWSENNGMPFAYDPAPEARVQRADYASQTCCVSINARKARQTIKLHCNGGTTQDLKVRGTGNSEFGADHKDFSIVNDNCTGRRGWNSAVVEVKTKATARMPIKDIYVADSGASFGFDIDTVCFS
jgi:hypothetical protein